jgi:hypothetical protein
MGVFPLLRKPARVFEQELNHEYLVRVRPRPATKDKIHHLDNMLRIRVFLAREYIDTDGREHPVYA